LQSTTCSRCAAWAESPAETLKFLKGERQTCPGCPHQAKIELVARQFQANCSKWWVVNGDVVIPVWITERLHSGRVRIV
jgi:hypothetical protein